MHSRVLAVAWLVWASLGVGMAQASDPQETPAAEKPALTQQPVAAEKPRPAHSPARRVNVVAQTVSAVNADSDAKDTARLLVLVVDDAGDPLDAVAVVVLAAGKEIASGESDARGRVLLRLDAEGPVTVRAAESGLVPSEARGVVLRKAGLTAVALPLEDAGSRAAK